MDRLTDEQMLERICAIEKGQAEGKTLAQIAQEMGMSYRSLANWRQEAVARGLISKASERAKPRPGESSSPAAKLRDALRRRDLSLEEIQTVTGLGARGARGLLDDMAAEGFNLSEINGRWNIGKSPPLPSGAAEREDLPTLVSRPDNTFLVGASGDQHLGSKYCRLDVLNDLYDRFARAGVQCVYNTGNWIDGEHRFNKHDLLVHGMEAQCRYLAKNFPRRAGIVTYAVSGDDHEGWYQQREGVDIGRFQERICREEGREDWVHLGFMEAYVRLVNANTGKASILSVVHLFDAAGERIKAALAGG